MSTRHQWLTAFGEVLSFLWDQRRQMPPKLSQRSFARYVKMSHSNLIKWTAGHVHSPQAQTVQRLEAALAVKPGRLTEIVRRNQENPNLTFAEAMEILKGGMDGSQGQNTNQPPPSPPAFDLDAAIVDRRTARKILKTADALAALLRAALGEQSTGLITRQAERSHTDQHRRPETRRPAPARNRQIPKRRGA